MKKIFYLAALASGLFMASCSSTKDSAYLGHQKLQAKQELARVNVNHTNQEVATAQAQTQIAGKTVADNKTIATNTVAEAKTTQPAATASNEKHSIFSHARHVQTPGHSLAQTINIHKIGKTAESLMKRPSFVASAKHASKAEGSSYLLMWIIFLVASILFYILAAAATLALNLGVGLLFYVLGVLCSIAALVFFILWIVQLING